MNHFLRFSTPWLRRSALLAFSAVTFGHAETGNLTEIAPEPSAMQVAPGFKIELLYSVPKALQGSWVSLAVDPKGRLIAGDQYGALYRITPPPIGTASGTKVERLNIDFSEVRVPARIPSDGKSA